MADYFDEELERSLVVQASRVPSSHDLGRSAITRAHGIRRRRRVVAGALAAVVVAIAVPVGLQIGGAATRGSGEIPPATPGQTTPSDPPERTITGRERVDVDFGALSQGEAPLVPYVDGRTVVVGGSSYEVPAGGTVAAATAFDGGAHAYLSRNGSGELIRVTAAGVEALGTAAAGPIGSPDLRWNAYATGRADKYGNVRTGITLAVFDSADGSTSTLPLAGANNVRFVALIDGTVYFRPERPDGGPQPLSSWAAGQPGPSVVPGSYDATALSPDGQVVADLTKITDTGSCSRVVDTATDTSLWQTCDYLIHGLTGQGEYSWAGPAYADGYSLGDLAILDGRTGEVIRRLPSFDSHVDFLDAVFEGADHLLLRAEQDGRTALVRCQVSTGQCELATTPRTGTAETGSPYLL